MENISISKPFVILVEGKLDKIVLRLILESISSDENLKDIINQTEIIPIGGKDVLKSNPVKFVINKAINENIIKGLLVIQDKDDNYESANQKLQNFLDKFDKIQVRKHIVIPDENSNGSELEDCLVECINYTEEKKQKLQNCINEISGSKKMGKKLFYTYLVINDDCGLYCSYIPENMLKNCIDVEKLNLLKSGVLDFLNSCMREFSTS